jgi:hypothetical protein
MKLAFTAYKQSKQVIAWFLRKTTMLEWMQVLTKPSQLLNNDLVSFKEQVIYEHHKLYETVAFESFINDEFDNTQRRITITHDDSYNKLLATYLLSENQPLPATYLLSEVNNDGSLSQQDLPITYLIDEQFSGVDFTVEIPTGLFTAADQSEISETVKAFKLMNVSFQILEV